MNLNVIPTPAELTLHTSDQSILRAEDFSLSQSIKSYVKKAEEVFDYHGGQEISLEVSEKYEEEEYSLFAESTSIKIIASSPKGAYYALTTLWQLFCLNDGEILPLTIHDKPTMPVRGFSDDISRGQISTMENFKDIIRRLSYVKCNVYMPYIEDTFAFERYPESGKYSDPVSPQEWKVLIRYAEDYYIDIIPIFNTMGHWDKNAKLEYFYPYVMKRNGGENGYPASSVDVRKPEAQRMIYDMLDELVDVFGKKGIHVGGDEVADYTSIFEKDLAGKYYNEHFNRMYDYLNAKGVKTFMYSDMYTPLYGDYSLGIEYIDNMPADMNFVFWDYACRADYPNIKNLIQRKKNFYLSPATYTWGRMLPHHYVSWENAKRMAEQGKEDAKGIIMSSWCDGGMSLREENWMGIHVGALYSWNCQSDRGFEDMVVSYFKLFFGVEIEIAQYNQLMSYDRCFVPHPYDEQMFGQKVEFWYDQWQGAGSRFFREFWKDATQPVDGELKEKLEGSEKIFQDAYEYFSAIEPKRNKKAYDAFVFDIKRSFIAAQKIAMLTNEPYHSREEAQKDIPKIDAMIRQLTSLLEENRQQWFACNRQSEWGYLESKYLDLIDSFRSLKRYCIYGKSLSDVKKL